MPLIQPQILTDIDFELWALDEHLKALEENIIFMESEDRKRTLAKLAADRVDVADDEYQFAIQDHEQRVKHVLPRYLRGSFLILLSAVFEAAIKQLADRFRHQAAAELKLRDIHGDFLERADKYFKFVLKRELVPDEKTKESLERMLVLRDAFAHANGRLDSIYPNDQPRIQKWLAANAGLTEDHGFILLSREYAVECLGTVRRTLETLLAAART